MDTQLIFPALDDLLKYLKNNHAGGRRRRDSEYPVNHYLRYNAEIDGFNTACQTDSQNTPHRCMGCGNREPKLGSEQNR